VLPQRAGGVRQTADDHVLRMPVIAAVLPMFEAM
jgi:hypothetical protein